MRLGLGLAVAVATFVVGVGGSGAAPVSDSPALKQLDWVLSVVNVAKAPSAATLERHFTPDFLRAIPSAQLVAAFYGLWLVRPLHLAAVLARQGQYGIKVRLDPRKYGRSFSATVILTPSAGHLISGIQFLPIAVTTPSPAPGSAGAMPTVAVLPTSSLEGVNGTPSPYYFGRMVDHFQFVTGGSGEVPKGMGSAASATCLLLYATGRSKGLYPNVRIFFYDLRNPPGSPGVQASSTREQHLLAYFSKSGYWRAPTPLGLATKTERVTATGGFWDPLYNYVNNWEDTYATYQGERFHVECHSFTGALG